MHAGFVQYANVLSIVGDISQVALAERDREINDKPRFGDLALVGAMGGGDGDEQRLAQVIRLDDRVA